MKFGRGNETVEDEVTIKTDEARRDNDIVHASPGQPEKPSIEARLDRVEAILKANQLEA